MLPVVLPVCKLWPWTPYFSQVNVCLYNHVPWPSLADALAAVGRRQRAGPPPRARLPRRFLRLQKPLPLFPPPNPTLSFSPPTFVFHPQLSLVQSFPSTAISISVLLSAIVAISWYVRPFQCLFLPPSPSLPQPSRNFEIPLEFSHQAGFWLRDLPSPVPKLAWPVLRHRDKSLWFRGVSHSQIGAPSTLDSSLPQPVTPLPSFNALPFFAPKPLPPFPTFSHLFPPSTTPFLFPQNTTLPSHSLPQSLPALLSTL